MNIEVNHVTKYYGTTEVLHDITVCLKQVSSIGIIGESGCGKSTLLRQLAGIENPNQGEILIDGISPTKEKKEMHQHMGYVFQKANLFPHLTVRENIMLILQRVYRMDKQSAKNRVMEVLRQLHIEEVAEQRPNTISGGQAQRASIARALATNPNYIFLDEPTAALDPVLTKEVLDSVLTLKKSGRGFVFVTHELSFLRDFADYIIFLKNGVICEMGDVTIMEHPRTKEMENFLLLH